MDEFLHASMKVNSSHLLGKPLISLPCTTPSINKKLQLVYRNALEWIVHINQTSNIVKYTSNIV